MKIICQILFSYLFGVCCVLAQNVAPTINASVCEKPAYPSASKRLNEEGTVQLKFLVGEDGRVIESAVEKSSGFLRLDEAAKQGLTKCSFKPGMINGVATKSWASMKYTWELEIFNPCVGSDVTKWTRCLGTINTPNGGLSVIEYENGKKSGRGIEYDKIGNVLRSGIFEGENLVSERNLNTQRYPFVTRLPINATNLSTLTETNQGNVSTSSFPICQGDKSAAWDKCIGTVNYFYGDKDVIEYQNGLRNGQGIEYDKNGLVLRSGTWINNKLVNSHTVDKTRFPFNTQPISLTSNNQSNAIANKVERDRLSLEVELERRKRQELEEQLRVVQQQSNKPTQSFVIERRVALVIGNASYKVNPLKNPVNDSTDMARSLRSVGFDVIEANNITLAQMREVTRRFADKLSNSDVGLVYYSGHGVEVKGKNYLIPVNADIKREYEVVDQAFDASQFLEMMDNIRGPNNKRVNILIVDACRNNELQKSWRSTNSGLARMDAPGGTFISFATAPGRVAADGAGRNSPYTKHLLQALKQPNVPIEQVFKVVRRNVMEETNGEQIPWENSSLVGDFYFTVQR